VAQVTVLAPEQPTEAPQTSVEAIIRAVANKYGLDEQRLVDMATCESTLNPSNVNYSYYENGNPSGLFQHISGYWGSRASKYGFTGASVFDAEANASVTAQMLNDGLGYMWSCKY